MKKFIILLISLCIVGVVYAGVSEEIAEPDFYVFTDSSIDDEVFLILDQDGTITFYTKSKEVLKVNPEGKFYVAGRCTAKDMRVYLKFKKWIEYIFRVSFDEDITGDSDEKELHCK